MSDALFGEPQDAVSVMDTDRASVIVEKVVQSKERSRVQ